MESTVPGMEKYVAFLRGINVGQRRVSMGRLVEVFQSIGHTNVATFIASGNVLFTSGCNDRDALESSASSELARQLGYRVDVIVRTAEQVIATTKAPVFHDEQTSFTLHVGLMKSEMPFAEVRKLEAVRTLNDRFCVIDREFYWLCRTRMSESIVWKLPETKAVQLPVCTLRNMNTLKKLAAKHLAPT